MIFSMTGFGRGEAETPRLRASAELRTVNHRGLDVRVHLPSGLGGLEPTLLRQLKKRLGRGRVECRIEVNPISRIEGLGEASAIAGAYEQLEGLRRELGVAAPITMADLLRLPGLFSAEPQVSLEEAEPLVLEALNAALNKLNESRAREGEALEGDLRSHLDALNQLFEQAAARAPKRLVEYRQRLEERLVELTEGNLEVPPERLLMETAIFADRADVAEELSRARAHLMELERLLGQDHDARSPVGKRLDFFLQELNREANTTSSKSRDVDLTRLTVEIKSRIESLREQCANVQ